MKPVTFIVERSKERVICEDTRDVRVIDGVEYLTVHREDSHRSFLMRRDSLKKIERKSINF
jgi:hypothetical protein